MSARSWPEDLPQFPDRGGLTRQPAGGRVYEPTDSGPGMTRPESSAAPEPLNLPLIFSSDEKARFWRFWNEEIGKGSAVFWFPAVDVMGWAIAFDDDAVLTDEDDVAITFDEWWLVMFRPDAEPPVFSPRSGDEWSAALPLWILIP